MNNLSIIVFIIVPIAMFGSAFLIARQLRALEGVPIFDLIFVRRRWLFSFVMGFLMSLLFMAIFGFVTGFSLQLFFRFLAVSLLGSLCYFAGVTLGWGNSTIANKADVPITNEIQIDTAFPENLTIEDSSVSIKITVNSKKRWVFFGMEVLQWTILGLCALPIVGFMVISFLQDKLPKGFQFIVWVIVTGLVLYLLYTKFLEILEYIFDKEIIEIDPMAVTIKKSGWRFSSKKEYPAENIKRLTALFPFDPSNVAIKPSRYVNANMHSFMLWHNRGLKRYHTFGRAISVSNAQKILTIVYARFPQYKG